jgi:hypothetical protein
VKQGNAILLKESILKGGAVGAAFVAGVVAGHYVGEATGLHESTQKGWEIIFDKYYQSKQPAVVPPEVRNMAGHGAAGTHQSSPVPAGSSDPITLPRVNPGRDCNGNCKPCPSNSPAWEVNEPGHGSPTTHWHWIEYHQNPITCECYPIRRSSPTKPPGA